MKPLETRNTTLTTLDLEQSVNKRHFSPPFTTFLHCNSKAHPHGFRVTNFFNEINDLHPILEVSDNQKSKQMKHLERALKVLLEAPDVGRETWRNGYKM
jgi:hypothetical protein